MSATQEQRWPILEGIALTGFGTSAVLTRELKDVLRQEAQSLLAARDALLREREELRAADYEALRHPARLEAQLAEAQREIEQTKGYLRYEFDRAEQAEARVAELEAQLQAAQEAAVSIAAEKYASEEARKRAEQERDEKQAAATAWKGACEAAEEKLVALRMAAQALLTLMVEPKCPECHVGVDRPKCFLDLNPVECPRHDIRIAWERKIRHEQPELLKRIAALLAEADQKGE